MKVTFGKEVAGKLRTKEQTNEWKSDGAKTRDLMRIYRKIYEKWEHHISIYLSVSCLSV